MKFSLALDSILDGMTMTRVAWNDPKAIVFLDEQNRLMYQAPDGQRSLYMPNHDDLFARDWEYMRRIQHPWFPPGHGNGE